MRYLILLALLAAMLAAPAAAQSLTQATNDGRFNEDFYPSVSDDGNHIVWIKESQSRSDLYVMDAWNLTPTKLTTIGTITFPGGAAVSGDGKQIAFVTGNNLWMLPTTGGTPKQITSFTGTMGAVRDVALSRDGSKVGVTVFDSASKVYDYAVVDTKTSSVRLVTGATAANDYLYGTMSSDGSLVAFTAQRGYPNSHVFLVATDGTNLRRASTLNARAYTYPSLDYAATRCAFEVLVGADYEVYTVRTDGTGLVNVSQNSAGKDASPKLSADGQRVVWKSQTATAKYGDVYMAYPDGSGLRQAIAINGLPPATSNASLAVNGDGSIVVYASQYPSGYYDLWVWMDRLTRSAASAPKPGNQVALILQDPTMDGGSYLMRSAFSRAPGINLPGVGTVPLTPDALFWLSGAAPTVFVNYAGTLNAKGQAGAFINVPNQPALKGFGFYTAAAAVKASTTTITNPILITIE